MKHTHTEERGREGKDRLQHSESAPLLTGARARIFCSIFVESVAPTTVSCASEARAGGSGGFLSRIWHVERGRERERN